MAAVDPIVYAQLCKLFPKLTQIQVTDACLYASGATYKEIGELRGVSPETIKKSLEAAQKRLEIGNLQTLRMVFLSRIILGGSSNNTQFESSISFGSIPLSEEAFIPLVPELSLRQATYVFHFVCGLTFELIADVVGVATEDIRNAIDGALSALQIPSLSALRIYILSKLLINLVLVSGPAIKH
ncbi:helix-turn-helix transcriptional regulator [Pantoea sp. KXB25]|uniref:helix-turn-helix transcriptional regulator n=1 Tax=unclassified Pantoea TaxID=2630326 RepID=UPI003AB90CC0